MPTVRWAMRQNDERSAVIVIRAWHESGSGPRGVVARITQTLGAPGEGWDESAAAGDDEILAAVRAWLGALTAQCGDASVTRAD